MCRRLVFKCRLQDRSACAPARKPLPIRCDNDDCTSTTDRERPFICDSCDEDCQRQLAAILHRDANLGTHRHALRIWHAETSKNQHRAVAKILKLSTDKALRAHHILERFFLQRGSCTRDTHRAIRQLISLAAHPLYDDEDELEEEYGRQAAVLGRDLRTCLKICRPRSRRYISTGRCACGWND